MATINKQIVVVCIGSSKISGDSLGPLVGSILRERNFPYYVYGTTENSINGKNIKEYLEIIKLHHKDSIIIGIDAAVGAKEEIGQIKIKEQGILAGGALNKMLPTVGDVGIVGVVAEKTPDVLGELLAVPFSEVELLAEEIADKLLRLCGKIQPEIYSPI